MLVTSLTMKYKEKVRLIANYFVDTNTFYYVLQTFSDAGLKWIEYFLHEVKFGIIKNWKNF